MHSFSSGGATSTATASTVIKRASGGTTAPAFTVPKTAILNTFRLGRLEANARALPTDMEFKVLSFCDAAELSNFSFASKGSAALICKYLRSVHSVTLDLTLDPTRRAFNLLMENARCLREIQLVTPVADVSRLGAGADLADLIARNRHFLHIGADLANLILLNRKTLRRYTRMIATTHDNECDHQGSELYALGQCSQLQAFDGRVPLNRFQTLDLGDLLSRMLLSCHQLRELHLNTALVKSALVSGDTLMAIFRGSTFSFFFVSVLLLIC